MNDRNILESVIDSFDNAHPGYGIDVVSREPHHYADAYALIMSAASKMGLLEISERCASWLLCDWMRSANRFPGWGLPVKYRAFGSSENSMETTYGITLAHVAEGAMDFAEASPESARPIMSAVVQSLDAYSANEQKQGFMYSDQGPKSVFVPNVEAMLSGQYARASKFVTLQKAKKYQAIAKRSCQRLAQSVRNDGTWIYADGFRKTNDLLHHLYILIGLENLQEVCAVGHWLESSRRHLDQFWVRSNLMELPVASGRRRLMASIGLRRLQPARLWGVGTYFRLNPGSCWGLQPGLARKILSRYESRAGYVNVPGSDCVSVRQNAHLAWGLASSISR